jgi:hypothetical protein
VEEVVEDEVGVPVLLINLSYICFLGYTSTDRTPHGGEKSASKAPQNDSWSNDISGSIANTDDWASTAVKTSTQEWTVDQLSNETQKLSVGVKKNFTVIKVSNRG